MARTLMARLPWLSNSLMGPYKILPIAQENKYSGIWVGAGGWGEFSYFIMKLYGLWGDSNKYTQHTIIYIEEQIFFPKLSQFVSWPGAMTNLQWLELPTSQTNFHAPKDVRANEVRLYLEWIWQMPPVWNQICKIWM